MLKTRRQPQPLASRRGIALLHDAVATGHVHVLLRLLRLGRRQLQAEELLRRVAAHQRPLRALRLQQRPRHHHLRIGHVGAVLHADAAEGEVAHGRQRSDDQLVVEVNGLHFLLAKSPHWSVVPGTALEHVLLATDLQLHILALVQLDDGNLLLLRLRHQLEVLRAVRAHPAAIQSVGAVSVHVLRFTTPRLTYPDGTLGANIRSTILHISGNIVTVFAVVALGTFCFAGNETALHNQRTTQPPTSMLHSILVFRPTSARFLLVLCVIPWSASETTTVGGKGLEITRIAPLI